MTRTTYYDNSLKQGAVLFRWNLRRNVISFSVYLALLAFFVLINLALTLSTKLFGEVAGTMLGFSLTEMLVGETVALGVIFSLIFSLCNLSYMHKKRETDLIASMPVNRRTMFFSAEISAIIMAAVPMLLVLLGVNILAENINSNTYMGTLNAFISVAVNVLFFGLLSVCCGKTSDKIITFLFVNGGVPVSLFLLQLIPIAYIRGFGAGANEKLTLCFTTLNAYRSDMPIYWTLFAIVCGALSFALIKRRRSECAEVGFAYKLPMVAIKLIVSLAVGMITGFILYISGFFSLFSPDAHSDGIADYVRFLAGMLIGSFLAYFVVGLIYARGFKGFAKSLIPYGAMIICFTAYFLFFALDPLGTSRIPEASEVKSVSFTQNNRDFRVGGKNLTKRELTDKASIEKALDAEFSAVSERSLISAFGYGFGTSVLDSEEEPNIFIRYNMNDGGTIERVYTSLSDWSMSVEFRDSEFYIRNSMPIFMIDSKYCTEVKVTEYDYETAVVPKTKNRIYKGEKAVSALEKIRDKVLTDGQDIFYYTDKSYEITFVSPDGDKLTEKKGSVTEILASLQIT